MEQALAILKTPDAVRGLDRSTRQKLANAIKAAEKALAAGDVAGAAKIMEAIPGLYPPGHPFLR